MRFWFKQVRLFDNRRIRVKSGVSKRWLVLQYLQVMRIFLCSSGHNHVFPNAHAHVRMSCKQICLGQCLSETKTKTYFPFLYEFSFFCIAYAKKVVRNFFVSFWKTRKAMACRQRKRIRSFKKNPFSWIFLFASLVGYWFLFYFTFL